jgi:CBS domain-containing protein
MRASTEETTKAPPVTGGEARVRIYAADEVVTIDPSSTLSSAARELAEDQIGLVVLGSLGEVVAVLSERDVVRAVATGADPEEMPAMDAASTHIVWCDADATVAEVVELMMECYVRHVLLEEEGRLVGIVSARDLLGALIMPAA